MVGNAVSSEIEGGKGVDFGAIENRRTMNMAKIPSLDDLESDENIGLTNEVVDNVVTNYFDFKTETIKAITKIGIKILEVIDNENEREHQRKLRDHPSLSESTQDVAKVSKTALAPKSRKSTSTRSKQGSRAG